MTTKAVEYICAVLLIVSSIALAFFQVIDLKDVANGTLMYIAQAFLLAGSIFGLDYYMKKFISLYDKGQDRDTRGAQSQPAKH